MVRNKIPINQNNINYTDAKEITGTPTNFATK